MEGAEKQTKDETLKSQIAIRCAKAAFLISSLKSSPNRATKSVQDKEVLMREMADLKIELVRERVKNRRIKVCSVMEVILQVLLMLSLWTFCLMMAFKFH